jgi:hypothetical protein
MTSKYPYYIVEGISFDDYDEARAFAESRHNETHAPVWILEKLDDMTPAHVLERAGAGE